MKVTYIGHSGFLLETEERYYLFDYFEGQLPKLIKDKPITVLSSHSHRDHYNRAVFDLLQEQGVKDVFAVLSRDIPKEQHPAAVPVLQASADQTYALPGADRLLTLRSTDQGVAFLLHVKEGTVYHAGDLNDWIWDAENENDERENRQMHSSFIRETDKLREKHIRVAFVPLDPRQKDHYADGMLYFLSAVGADAVYPMHYWKQSGIMERFLRTYPQYRDVIRNTEKAKGETI